MHQKDHIIESGELKTIINSQVLRRILQRSRAYHQGKVNEYVRAQNLISAYGALSRIDFIDKLGNIIQTEYNKLTKEGRSNG